MISPENLDGSEISESSEDPAHYDQKEGQYGYNKSTIIYPLYSDKNQAMNIDLRRSPEFSFPSKLIPKFDQEYKCKKHGNTFNENDACLKLCATHIIVHEENKETIYPCNVYYRETVGSCKNVSSIMMDTSFSCFMLVWAKWFPISPCKTIFTTG